MTFQITNTDYAILKCIQDAEQALWKTRIHEQLAERIGVLPHTSAASVQTVGRHVDNLHEYGHLDHKIVSSDDVQRDLIIAYELTGRGKRAIREKREHLLKEIVRNKLFAENEPISLGKRPVVELIADEFVLNEDTKQLLLDNYNGDEIVLLLNLYYTEKEVNRVFGGDNRLKFKEVVSQSRELAQIIDVEDRH